MLSYGELVRMIKGAGKEPVERDALYGTVRTFAPDDPIFTPAAGDTAGAAATGSLVHLVGSGRA